MAKVDSKTEQNQLIADPQQELEKIAGMLGVEPKQAAEAISALMEGHAAFDVLCNNLLSSNVKRKHDGRGNWRMLVPKEDWEAFVTGVTPLLTTASEC